ncbi:type IV pilus twitching motility protein PilT [Pseudoramibacter sp.]|jgi:twitching motility protein PilT|uniref:type IV pilus twitching motility protein PilT n=1 Tax=Pseudoramibacter sp. TaxID=2034862 RepID=UPI0025D40FBB|nr:PilT/PilU family type 4a pilus ATPase [Pseudoramibacter sp.]MCH4073024.1 PilT/PilU family type 4a pilus ATPase [Pseudoramibacter sp.]MCH4106795.1 PilT/PilU family type 4a pilus ATPase [Pseudoramibacter sp.]
MKAYDWIVKAAHYRASDVHFSVNERPKCRIDGVLCDLSRDRLDVSACEQIAKALLDGDKRLSAQLMREKSVDFSKTIEDIRCRINLFFQRRAIAAAIRLLPGHIPDLNALGLPDVVSRFGTIKNGLVLVCGPTGSGKSTTLAAILNQINLSRAVHLITLEDPVEYLYPQGKALIHQREIGFDVQDYASGLRDALREDPDVLLIGEMRDSVTVKIALEAAETGHLVFSTLHTPTAEGAIDRVLSLFSGENQIGQMRQVLSMNLKAVLWQQLLPRAGAQGRVCAAEILIVTPAVQHLIREGQTQQLYNYMLTEKKYGSQTMDADLLRLCRTGRITPKTALCAARNRAHFKDALKKLSEKN